MLFKMEIVCIITILQWSIMIQQWVGGHNGPVVCQSQTLGEREIIGARYRGRNIFRVGNFSLEKIREAVNIHLATTNVNLTLDP